MQLTERKSLLTLNPTSRGGETPFPQRAAAATPSRGDRSAKKRLVRVLSRLKRNETFSSGVKRHTTGGGSLERRGSVCTGFTTVFANLPCSSIQGRARRAQPAQPAETEAHRRGAATRPAPLKAEAAAPRRARPAAPPRGGAESAAPAASAARSPPFPFPGAAEVRTGRRLPFDRRYFTPRNRKGFRAVTQRLSFLLTRHRRQPRCFPCHFWQAHSPLRCSTPVVTGRMVVRYRI